MGNNGWKNDSHPIHEQWIPDVFSICAKWNPFTIDTFPNGLTLCQLSPLRIFEEGK